MAFYLPVDSMGLSLADTAAVVAVAVVRHVARTAVAVGMWCTNCFVRLVVVGVVAGVAAVAVAVAIPIAGDNNHLNPADCCFALRRIDVDRSKEVATNKRHGISLDFITRRQSIIFIRLKYSMI